MKNLKTIYIPTKNEERTNFLKGEVYYDEGRRSMFTLKEIKRGFYMSITPVNRKNCGSYFMESGNGGRKMLIEEVNRYSKKSGEKAVDYFDKNIKKIVLDYFSEHIDSYVVESEIKEI